MDPNSLKQYKTKQNISLVSHGVDRVHSLWKIRTRLRGTNFALIAPVQPILHRVSCSNEMVPNANKHYETHQNMSLGSGGVDWVDLLQKILMQLCGLKFCINNSSLARFEPSIVKQRNGPKFTQTLQNKTKHKFSVPWGGSSAFFAKNSDTTSWHELCINCTISAHFAPSSMQ